MHFGRKRAKKKTKYGFCDACILSSCIYSKFSYEILTPDDDDDDNNNKKKSRKHYECSIS